MNYVTTNIRIAEEDYLKLKGEAARKRKSFSAIVREKLNTQSKRQLSPEALMQRVEKHARENAKYTKGFDSVKALREIRYEGKW